MREFFFRPEDVVSVSVSYVDSVTVVRVTGEVDMATGAVVEDPLLVCLDARPRAVVIDLTQVDYLGSTGLNLLVNAFRLARERSVAMHVVANTPVVLRPFELSGLDVHLPISRSVDDALKRIGATGNVSAGR